MSDLYPRPSRQEIAERVKAISEPATAAPGNGDVVAWFGTHVRSALAARGWTVADLATRTGDAAGNLSQAAAGTKCPLAIAGRIAGALGIPLAEMVVPYTCRTCAGVPPKGYACLECGTEARAA